MVFQKEDIFRLAELIYNESLSLAKGDVVIIEGIDVPSWVLRIFSDRAKAKGYVPILLYKSEQILTQNAELEIIDLLQAQAEFEIKIMRLAKAFIGLRAMVEVDDEVVMGDHARSLVLRHFLQPVHYEWRIQNLQWLYFRLPTRRLFSQTSNVKAAAKNYFDSVFLSYRRLNEAMEPLAARLRNGSLVAILNDGEELSFTLSGKGVVKSAGQRNLPDGEVFTAPERKSVNGAISFNTPTTYYGKHFSSIRLTFVEGRVVAVDAGDETASLEAILDTDEGARYCGEFAFGLNPMITSPINDILYDEKQRGTLHLALGNAYPESDNGNRSAIHWDLILDLVKCGGSVYLDGELINLKGRFVPQDLQHLNFDGENLTKYTWQK